MLPNLIGSARALSNLTMSAKAIPLTMWGKLVSGQKRLGTGSHRNSISNVNDGANISKSSVYEEQAEQ